MTPVLARMGNGGGSSKSNKKGGSSKSSKKGGMFGGSFNNRPESRGASSNAESYGGEQIELNLDGPVLDEIEPQLAATTTTSYNEEPLKKKTGKSRTPEQRAKRNKKCLLIILALCIVGAAIGAALGVTMTKDKSSNNGDASNASDNEGVPSASTTRPPTPAVDPDLVAGSGTRPPTPADEESVSKEIAALSVLKSILPVESYAAVSDVNLATPQNAALDWILYEDEFMDPYWEGLSQNPPDEEAEFHFIQRYVAMTLYTVLDGVSWADNSNWKTSEDVCTWYGIDCVGEDVGEGAYQEQGNGGRRRELQEEEREGTIIGLKLSQNFLDGWLPADISALTSLQHLEMHKNKIRGELPPYLYDMTSLRTLFLDDNKIEGEIPAEVGNLVNLEKLTLNENEIWGEIPVEIGLLTKLNM